MVAATGQEDLLNRNMDAIGGSFESNQGEVAWLTQSTKTIKRSGFYMQQAIEEASMDEALRHSAVMLGELRTNALGPLKYFELYMTALNMLNVLERYFMEYIGSAEDVETAARDLYQRVQHAGNVIPRLYLLCTVGTCAVKSCADAEKVMRDMEDMCKGVQHPIRGLFLRAYLLHCVKSVLPDDESSVRFLLENFIEMNKLWVRMKLQRGIYHMGEKEREQLADLVGKNLTQLSHLEYLSFDVYSKMVLPKILDQVVSCNDTLAQGYLMECITAAFPDEFQVGTMDQLLNVLPKLNPKVQMSSVLGSMLDRLARYSESSGGVIQNLDDIDAFSKISKAVEASISAHLEDMSGEAVTSMYGGLLSFAVSVYPDRIHYIDSILGHVRDVFIENKDLDTRAERKIIDLLCIPLEKYSIKTTLHIKSFLTLIGILSEQKKKDLAYKIAGMVAERGEMIDDIYSARSLFQILRELALDDADFDNVSTFSRSLHCFKMEKSSEQMQFLSEVFHYIQASEQSVRCIGPSIVLISLDVFMHNDDIDMSHFIFVIQVAQKVADTGAYAISISLFLRTALACSHIASEKVLYECFERAFIVFEDYIQDSKECQSCLSIMINALYEIDTIAKDARDMLIFKARSYCSKLLRRKDQCQAMLSCCRVYWQEKGVKDGNLVLETLTRAERIIKALQEQNSIMDRTQEESRVPGYLLVELLDHYAYFEKKGVPDITKDVIKRISDLATAELSSQVCQGDDALQKYFQATLASLRDAM